MIISDPSSVDFNCYVSYDDALSIVDSGMHFTNWDSNTSRTDRERSLITASMMLDAHTYWIGSASEADQPMSWPRTNVQVYDRPSGTYFESDEIPEFLMVATVYYAEAIIGSNIFANSDSELEELKVDTIMLKFKEFKSVDTSVPDIVKTMISRYGTVETAGGSTVKLVRR